MIQSERPILVLGATGQQGGSVAHCLLAGGWNVRALSRDPSTQAARELQASGVQLVAGDMNDRGTLELAMRDAHGVFSIQPTEGGLGTPAGYTVDDELRLGEAVAEAAAAAGVDHFVYSSVAGAERDHGISRWRSKWLIEQRIAELGLPATVLRPVRFMENHADDRYGVKGDVLTDVFNPDVPVQLIAVSDIGAIAGLAFGSPQEYLARAIEIAGDELPMPRIVEEISRATGRRIEYRQLTREVVEGIGGDALAGYRIANEHGGWQADIPALRELHPQMMRHSDWLEQVGQQLFSRLFARQAATTGT